jgi:UDP-N-acetylmuramate-alanine ligase
VAAIVRIVKPGDLVITLGAGSIGNVPDRLIAALESGAPAGVES